MWNDAPPLQLTRDHRETLDSWVAASSTPQNIVSRCLVILMAADGLSNTSIAKELVVSRPTVILWRKRFVEGGPEALTRVAPGRGRKKSIKTKTIKALVEKTLHSHPRNATHWSTRTMAKEMGVSHSTVHRIWDIHGLQPHRVRSFKLSRDPKFVEKLTDVVGLYMDPPDKAIVLCVDEKSQIQALDRTQPGLPMKKGRCGTMTHDYKRHGTTTLFAALDVLTGHVVGQCLPRHRHQEFLRFLRKLDRSFPEDLDLHLIVDNYGTHSRPEVKDWLKAHPRFKLHFTPTSASWVNLVERWFRDLTTKRLRRGAFCSVQYLVQAINQYIRLNNADPKPFMWTATTESILAKLKRCKAIYDPDH